VNEHIVNKSAVKKIVKVDRNIIKTVSSLYPSTTLKGSRSRLLAPFVYTTANKQLQEQTAYSQPTSLHSWVPQYSWRISGEPWYPKRRADESQATPLERSTPTPYCEQWTKKETEKNNTTYKSLVQSEPE
jgi:hypothetical protein